LTEKRGAAEWTARKLCRQQQRSVRTLSGSLPPDICPSLLLSCNALRARLAASIIATHSPGTMLSALSNRFDALGLGVRRVLCFGLTFVDFLNHVV
jgi:hypothetical protein